LPCSTTASSPLDADDAPILVYINPDEAERRTLIDSFKVDEHTLLSTLDPEELAAWSSSPATRR